jgi:cation:H+ antiporter
MLYSIITLTAGLAILVYSANKMINSANLIANHFNLSPMLIGLTIIAFGTSAPELAITVIAATNSPPNIDAIIGNVIGSNIANILLVLGFAGLFFKLDLSKLSKKDNFYLGLITVYFIVIFFLFDGINIFTNTGFIFLILFFINYIKNFKSIINNSDNLNFSAINYLYLLLSFLGLFFGGKLFLDNSLSIFLSLGVSEAVIGITVLAIGTSLPELATVVISYIKKSGEIGIGNIIGSNMMNILFVFFPGTIIVQLRQYDFSLSAIDTNPLIILLLATLVIIFMSLSKTSLTKWTSVLFLLSYLACGVWIFI